MVKLALFWGYLKDEREHILLFSFVAGSCSAPNFICYRNDSLCDLTYYIPTNISIVVFWSSFPILQDERTVTSNCRCKEVTFSCHIAIENSIQGNIGISSISKSISCICIYVKNIFVSSYFYITSVPYLQASMSAWNMNGNMRIIYVNMQNK